MAWGALPDASHPLAGAGLPSHTEASLPLGDHDLLGLGRYGYDNHAMMAQPAVEQAFMFAYSLRPRTHAFHRMQDDVPPPVKLRRLQVRPRLARMHPP